MKNHSSVLYRLLYRLLCLLLVSLIIACATETRFTLTWRDPNYSGGPLKDILVLGVSDQQGRRRVFEDTFAQAFKTIGVNSVAGYTVLPGENSKPDQKTINQAVASQQTDGVLVTHLLGVDEKEIYHPPMAYSFPRSYRVGGYYGHYITVWDYVHQPGYYSQHQFVRLESNLYATKSGKLIWSAQSETIDPESANALIESLSREVIANLKKEGLI
jgi:hypothetical protein